VVLGSWPMASRVMPTPETLRVWGPGGGWSRRIRQTEIAAPPIAAGGAIRYRKRSNSRPWWPATDVAWLPERPAVGVTGSGRGSARPAHWESTGLSIWGQRCVSSRWPPPTPYAMFRCADAGGCLATWCARRSTDLRPIANPTAGFPSDCQRACFRSRQSARRASCSVDGCGFGLVRSGSFPPKRWCPAVRWPAKTTCGSCL